MIRTPLLIASALALALATPARAQYAGGAAASETAAPVPTQSKVNNFEALSAGDRKIGRALFLAQHPTASGPAPLSLNQIADLKAHGSWAKVFAQMQSRGLLHAKTLGQIVNGYQRGDNRRPPARISSNDRSPTLVTGGDGSVIASSQRGGISHGGDVVGETGTPDIAAADKHSR